MDTLEQPEWEKVAEKWLEKESVRVSVLTDLQTLIKEIISSRDTYWKERVTEIVGFVDEEFLAQPDCEEYPAEWAINKDRQRILQALDNLK